MSDSDEPEPSSAAEDSDDDFDDEAVEQEEEDDEPVIMSQAEIKRANVQAMLSGSLEVQRKPMVRGLQCQNVAAVLAQPFRAPFAGATAGHSAELARRLAARPSRARTRSSAPKQHWTAPRWESCCTGLAAVRDDLVEERLGRRRRDP